MILEVVQWPDSQYKMGKKDWFFIQSSNDLEIGDSAYARIIPDEIITTVFQIWCEWDMPFADLYSTEEKAQEAIDNADWGSCDTTLKEAQENGLVSIYPLVVDGF